jgi:hypothetical protein
MPFPDVILKQSLPWRHCLLLNSACLKRSEKNWTLVLKLCEDVNNGGRGEKWKVVDGLITVVGKVYVPSSSRSLLAILSWAHDFDHEGAEKTLH